MHGQLYVLGSRGSRPVCGREFLEFGGGTTCYIFKRGDHAVVIDCGSGLYDARSILQDCRYVDVLLTHLHYDHIMGLLEWSVFPREAQLRFYAQFDRWFGGETLKRFLSPPFWPVSMPCGVLMPMTSPGEAELGDGLRVRLYPSCHPDGASLVRLETPEGDICAAFDFEHARAFPEQMARGCEYLLYDGMYTLEEYPDHVGWGHSCWEEGSRLAGRLGIPHLIITHHSPSRSDEELRALEARARRERPEIRFARAGDVFHFSKRADGRRSEQGVLKRGGRDEAEAHDFNC